MIGSKEILGGPSAFSSSTINILAPLSVHNKCAFTFISHSTWNSAPDPISRSLFQRQNIKSLSGKSGAFSQICASLLKKRGELHPPNIIVTHPQHPRGEREITYSQKKARSSRLEWLAGRSRRVCLCLRDYHIAAV
jgi:hypothetical protein